MAEKKGHKKIKLQDLKLKKDVKGGIGFNTPGGHTPGGNIPGGHTPGGHGPRPNVVGPGG